MPVDTKAAPRRDLTFSTLDELVRELDRLEAASAAGTLAHTGNWTAGQVCEHCAKFMRGAIDGFDTKAPWFVRVVARRLYFKQMIGPGPMPAGIKLPKQAVSMLPTPGVSDRAGIADLRRQVDRLRAGAKMTIPSPVFGAMTHEHWMIVHLKHCAMHMSFLRYA